MSVALLAGMVCVLAAMVGYVYWQQQKTRQSLANLASFLASHFSSSEEVEIEKEKEEADSESDSDSDSESEEDDRVSVKNEVVTEVVSGPPPPDDDVDGKTAAELKEMLTKKGIPFGKRDPKTVLIQLLKASS